MPAVVRNSSGTDTESRIRCSYPDGTDSTVDGEGRSSWRRRRSCARMDRLRWMGLAELALALGPACLYRDSYLRCIERDRILLKGPGILLFRTDAKTHYCSDGP